VRAIFIELYIVIIFYRSFYTLLGKFGG